MSVSFLDKEDGTLTLRDCVQKVESFPFNWFNDPMYLGSTLTFTAGALW